MTGKRLVRALGCCSAIALTTAATTALAQTAQSSEADTTTGTSTSPQPDVVVIARGRQEEEQKTPVSITSFSAKQIDDARIKDVSDFIALTPNVSIVESQSVGNSFITVRGISQVRNGESPVAVVVDGVQQISPRQFTSDLFDVQQIEVLRGPQGALYGRNAIGGAIIITTKQPTNDFHVDADLSAGNGSDYRAELAVSGPIVKDKLLFRVSGSLHNFGGLLNNVYLNQTVDRLRDRNVRAELKANLTDSLTAEINGGYSATHGIGNQYQYQSANFASPTSCFLDPVNPFGGPAPDADRVSRRFCANNRGSNVRSIVDASLKIQNTANWGTITNVFSWVDVNEYIGTDQFPYTASRNVFGTDGTQTQFEEDRAWQNDFRIAAPASNRFRWMVGAYYLHTDRFISTTTGQDNGMGIVGVYRTPQFGNPVNPTLSFLADNDHNEAYAFYGNLSYDVTSKLEASAEFRYDHDHRHQIIDPLSTAGVPVGCTTGSQAACVRDANFGKAQPKFTLNYKANPDLTLFADWGVGFRSGQFNQAGTAVAANLPAVFDLVKAESASTTEAGFKSRFLGGRLKISATAFYTNDRNPFYFLFVGAVGAQILVNIDKVQLYGGEVELNFTPTKGLDLFGSYGYTHSNIREFTFNPTDVGNWAPYIPRVSATLGAQYRIPITTRYTLFTRGDLEHHGKQFWDPENATARSAFDLVNLRAGLETANGNWRLTGYVNNIADKKYNAEFVSGGFVQPAEPRTYGIELGARF